jgi:hypothetical protein
MSDMRSTGVWVLCGVVCLWPLTVFFVGRFIERRVKSQGWRSLLPPYNRHGGTDATL